MPTPKQPPTWPSDDDVRELHGDEQLSDDGRKLQDSERVGALAPDADADREPPKRPAKRPTR